MLIINATTCSCKCLGNCQIAEYHDENGDGSEEKVTSSNGNVDEDLNDGVEAYNDEITSPASYVIELLWLLFLVQLLGVNSWTRDARGTQLGDDDGTQFFRHIHVICMHDDRLSGEQQALVHLIPWIYRQESYLLVQAFEGVYYVDYNDTLSDYQQALVHLILANMYKSLIVWSRFLPNLPTSLPQGSMQHLKCMLHV